MPGEFIDANIMRRKLGFDVSVIRVVGRSRYRGRKKTA
jgi:hypothetical protein